VVRAPQFVDGTGLLMQHECHSRKVLRLGLGPSERSARATRRGPVKGPPVLLRSVFRAQRMMSTQPDSLGTTTLREAASKDNSRGLPPTFSVAIIAPVVGFTTTTTPLRAQLT